MRSIIIALALPFAWGACDSGGSMPDEGGAGLETPQKLSAMTELSFRDTMDELWIAHVTWTRVYLIDRLAKLPDTAHALGRLIENQADIGDAIRPFYGDAAGDQLTELLQDHIRYAGEVVAAAAAAKDSRGFTAANKEWRDNADDIARFLALANPNWDYDALRKMMNMHLDQLTAEANARIRGDWKADIAAFDETVNHIQVMSAVLSHGIAQQFPKQVLPSTLGSFDASLHFTMRKLWQEHVIWTRVYVIDAIAELPDAAFAAERLLRNQTEIGNAIRPIYGDKAADRLTELLRLHILGAASVVAKTKAGDDRGLAMAVAAWRQNGDDIAMFLASANPFLKLADLRAMMRLHLNQLLLEATARVLGRWDADIDAYDATVMHILEMSDAISAGISRQIPTIGHGGPL